MFELFRNVREVQMHFGIFGVFCIINCFFGCDYRIRCHFLYIEAYLKDILGDVLRCWENVPEV